MGLRTDASVQFAAMLPIARQAGAAARGSPRRNAPVRWVTPARNATLSRAATAIRTREFAATRPTTGLSSRRAAVSASMKTAVRARSGHRGTI